MEVWYLVLISDVGMSGTEHSILGVPWRSGAETCQLPWSTMESLVWEPVNTDGVP